MSNLEAKISAETLAASSTIPTWIVGPEGKPGPAGKDGIQGKDGKTPERGVDYWTAQDKQEVIDEAQKGIEIGAQGKSAYEVAVENGFVGTEDEWLASLVGPQGEQGPTGPKGDTGLPGKDGKQGAIGPQGPRGLQGERGPQGPTGEAGATGKNGTNGTNGLNGTDGFSPTITVKESTESSYKLTVTNADGSYDTPNLKGTGGGGGTGENGATFTPAVSTEGVISWTNDKGLVNPEPVDIKGPKGDKGADGAPGIQGPEGKPGKDGAVGPQGPIGLTGPAGADGKQGPQGIPGEKGADGLPGAQGPQGEPGVDGKPGEAGPQGPEGPKGADGAKGDTGDSGVYRGTVEPVDPSVKVWLDPSGEASNVVTQKYVDDAITAIELLPGPEGPQGPAGADGLPGAQGPAGKDGINGSNGVDGKDATINGVNTLELVQGDNITLAQEGNKMTISAAGGGGGSGWDLSDRIFAGEAEGSVRISASNFGVTPIKSSLYIGPSSGGSSGQSGGYCLFIGANHFLPDTHAENSAFIGNGHDIRRNAMNVFLAGDNNEVNHYTMPPNTYTRNSAAIGSHLGVRSSNQFANGKYNITDDATTYVYIIGNGSDDSTRSNALTLDWKGNGAFQGQVTSQGADYAEYFEWLDGNIDNKDRVGYIVTLSGDMIRFANEDDDVLGVVSGTVGVLGDNYEWNWHDKYLTDDFGRVLYDMVEEFSEDPETHEKHSLGKFPHPRLNPDYDPSKPYVKRSDRPEWDAVGMMGKLYVRDDGSAKVNGYVKPVNGIAVASDTKTNMRVMQRIDANTIRVLMR